ncbi:Hypothetical protein Tpal_1011 [Trichococcus palustris]|uniref:Uncharacterized protein n=1 Tax=Trichococcus palustris TaxID=140314 RepID=A0A143YGT0_9LACT|nr:hypothetical protein [Trichococcus palustris]CZQ88553.1 Hypothetical protein Tpal_1011 [Trichococcus palustris]SFL12828.1 hypothetical protein SAMN04488076_12225 [Trichococcus palustris]
MRKLRQIGRVLLSFILMFLVVALIGVIFMKEVLLNANDINNQLNDSEYYSQVEDSLAAKFKTLSLETSIPEDIFIVATTDRYGMQQLSIKNNEAAINYLTTADAKYTTETDRTMFEEPVTNYVKTYAAEHNQPFDEALQAQTDKIIGEATDIVASHTTLFNLKNVVDFPQFQKARNALHVISDHFYIVPVAFLAVSGLLVLLNRKRIHRSLIWIGSALVSGSAFVIIPATVALVLKLPQRITISADYINTALRTLALHYTQYFLVVGLVAFALGIASLVGYTLLSKAKRAQFRNRKSYASNGERA